MASSFFLEEYLLYMKDPLAISIIFTSSLMLILMGAVLFGFVNHPGHCGATNPHTIDWEEIYSDGGPDNY